MKRRNVFQLLTAVVVCAAIEVTGIAPKVPALAKQIGRRFAQTGCWDWTETAQFDVSGKMIGVKRSEYAKSPDPEYIEYRYRTMPPEYAPVIPGENLWERAKSLGLADLTTEPSKTLSGI